MGKVYGIHEIKLHPGVDEASFEQFWKEFNKDWQGWKWRLLKGDRGERAGKYAIMIEVESVEDRDRWAPASGVDTDDTKRYYEEHREELAKFGEKWVTFSPSDIGLDPEYTDYVEVD